MSPDLAIGRLTCDTPSELTTIVAKILAYEHNRDFGLWRRNVQFVAGVGGFDPVIDSVLEITAKNVILTGLPNAYAATMTQVSWRSAYCPDPRSLQSDALAGLNGDCAFWIYMGHGQRRGPGPREHAWRLLAADSRMPGCAPHSSPAHGGNRLFVCLLYRRFRRTGRLPGRRASTRAERSRGRAGGLARFDAVCHDRLGH